MSVNAERVELGIAALESGEYLKGTGYLHQVDSEGIHRHCCLGVFTLAAIANGLDVSREMIPAGRGEPEREIFGDNDGDEALCDQVMDWYGFGSDDPRLLNAAGEQLYSSGWNDHGPSPDRALPPEEDFTEIAKGFRRTFLQEEK